MLINILLVLYLEAKEEYFKFQMLNEDCFIKIKNTHDHMMKEKIETRLGN